MFIKGDWEKTINVSDFLHKNLTPYDGDASFLKGPTERTQKLWEQCKDLMKQEREAGGVLGVDTETISTILSHKPGYVDESLEKILGLQTDKPLIRAIKPLGGIRVVEKACEEHGLTLSPKVLEIFKYRKSHNDGVFSAYTPEIRAFRSSHVITGLPDNYARGRIIGDYRRVPLYGITRLIEAKQSDLDSIVGPMNDEKVRLREELFDQIQALREIGELAKMYGYDISAPATSAREAFQWLYFAYLAALKEHDGAAMSLGSVSGFLDAYIEHDIQEGKLTEEGAQELVDDFVIKLRLVRQFRAKEYDALFSGDPVWLTESLGGMFHDGRTKVTKTSFRFLQTLYNLGPSPEPNLTVLWSQQLPQGFKDFCAQVSIDTSSIQYENDDLMRPISGCDDYSISCCVSEIDNGTMFQYFGARCNLAKTLLLALNEGHDEFHGVQLVNGIAPLSHDPLNYDEVMERFQKALTEVVRVYVESMQIIHYMHDKYYYEHAQMALLDSFPKRVMAFGIAGFSVIVDSLNAIKYSKVHAHRDERGITDGFSLEGSYPAYGNDNDEADETGKMILKMFYDELQKHTLYRGATPTVSILTITSNIVYGKKTGATPDGRKLGEPFAPGANPMHGRDTSGALASLNSVAKMPYEWGRDGISNTFSIVPKTLGSERQDEIHNLVNLVDGYFGKGGHHLNVNVLNRDTLLAAMERPEEYPQLTVRVSGYAVNFIKLTPEQQREVIARTFFQTM